MILVDSSVWIDHFNGFDSTERVKLTELLKTGTFICITGIIVSEVLSGIRDEKKFQEIQYIFSRLPQYLPNFYTHVKAAEIYKGLRAKGITIKNIIDCLISAIAMENELPLLQKDRDYRMIRLHHPMLKLY